MNRALTTLPKPLKIFAIIGLVMVVISIPSIFSPFIKKLGTFYPLLFGSLVSLRFMALIGVWYMKKWGPILFLLVFLVFEITSMMVGISREIEFPVSAVLCLVFLRYVPRMDDNL